MEGLSLNNELVGEELFLSQLFLDPNNPRFSEFNHIFVEDIDIEAAQERVQELLISGYQIDKLRMNMEVNGYLPIDRIVVRQFSEDKYVILEGNRRIAAAKSLVRMIEQGVPVSEEVADSLLRIPCLLYTGTDTEASWIFQGLRHITGIHEWSAFNKAKLLVDQMEANSLSLSQVGQRFGLTAHGAGQWVRGYRAFKQARERSDYIAEVNEDSYPYFQELFSQSSIAVREWIGWNDEVKEFKDELNFNEFISWLYPRPEGNPDARGDFEKRRIARRDDIRTIAYLIKQAPDEFYHFRSGTDLERAFSVAQSKMLEEETRRTADPTARLFTALELCIKELDNIPWKAMQNLETRERLFGEFDKLVTIIKGLRE